ncbi:hypothetical protein [Flavobacterium sp. SM2513]|uniref:hypothetical protein n=1 Tax=Flavobacterium sp. SM2513 TaxID=3424766 RepID=UPI003D7FCBC0
MAATDPTTTKNKRSVSETGHNKNVANFGTAYQILEEMGPLYQPSNPNLFLDKLNPVKTVLEGAITEMNTDQPIYKNFVAEREVTIAPLGKLMTRALNSALSTTISAKDKQNLTSMAKKIRGGERIKPLDPAKAPENAISTSQMSYDSRIANLDAFISQLESHPEYSPNEEDIKIAALRQYHQTLKAQSSKVNASGNRLITARKNRNEALYFGSPNVMELMEDVKSYLKSIGEPAKPYYKALVKLQFRYINETKK